MAGRRKVGGVEVDDRRWQEMRRIAAQLGNKVVKVGVIGDKAEDEHGEGISMGRLAGVHEFGASIKIGNTIIVIPERSFIRAPLAQHRADYVALIGKFTDRVLLGRMSVDRALGLLGIRAVADMQRFISRGVKPDNAPSTIARKGSSKPLIDTGLLRQAITYAVVDADDIEKT